VGVTGAPATIAYTRCFTTKRHFLTSLRARRWRSQNKNIYIIGLNSSN